MSSVREAALVALLAAVRLVPGATVQRETVVPEAVPPGGLIILRDGAPGEPETTLSPLTYHYEHAARLEVMVQGAGAGPRAVQLDCLLVALGHALAALGRHGEAAEALRNAHRFHPARAPKMTISVRPTDDGALRLDFVDDGVHLSTQQLSLAFRPYYQADPHHTGEIPGMGIGLSHVLALVWNHGGSCSLRNRADAPGVCLSVTLPAVMTAAC